MTICYRCEEKVEEQTMVSSLHPQCFCNWFHLPVPEDFHDVVARSNESQDKDRNWVDVNTSFFHGKFRKYSASINNSSYILKVMQKEVPELPLTEYLCNQLARTLGLEVPDHYI